MKLTDQMTNCTSPVFKTLKNLSDKANDLENQAKRYRQMNHHLSYLIRNEYITNEEKINCAITWLEHSDLSPSDIIVKKIFNKD